MFSNPICPLCTQRNPTAFFQDRNRSFFQCLACRLVFVPPEQHLDQTAEKAIYDLHRNTMADTGYRRFLARLAVPILGKFANPAEGLDYGCGPGPVLAEMLVAAGHRVALYDPLYACGIEYLERQYDFITCSEVVEHFREPGAEFARLFSLLKPGGFLGLMTKQVIDAEAFSRWHYKNDLTHIGFFSKATFDWLATHYRCEVEFHGADVIIFKKPPIHAD